MNKDKMNIQPNNQKNHKQQKIPHQNAKQQQFFSNNIIMNNFITIENGDYGNKI